MEQWLKNAEHDPKPGRGKLELKLRERAKSIMKPLEAKSGKRLAQCSSGLAKS